MWLTCKAPLISLNTGHRPGQWNDQQISYRTEPQAHRWWHPAQCLSEGNTVLEALPVLFTIMTTLSKRPHYHSHCEMRKLRSHSWTDLQTGSTWLQRLSSFLSICNGLLLKMPFIPRFQILTFSHRLRSSTYSGILHLSLSHIITTVYRFQCVPQNSK